MFFFAFDALQCLLVVNLAYKSVGNFKKNPNIVQSSSIAVPDLAIAIARGDLTIPSFNPLPLLFPLLFPYLSSFGGRRQFRPGNWGNSTKNNQGRINTIKKPHCSCNCVCYEKQGTVNLRRKLLQN